MGLTNYLNLSFFCYTLLIQTFLFNSFPSLFVDKVGDLSFLLKALSYRERVLQRSLAARLHTKVSVNGALSEREGKKQFPVHVFSCYLFCGSGGAAVGGWLFTELIGCMCYIRYDNSVLLH